MRYVPLAMTKRTRTFHQPCCQAGKKNPLLWHLWGLVVTTKSGRDRQTLGTRAWSHFNQVEEDPTGSSFDRVFASSSSNVRALVCLAPLGWHEIDYFWNRVFLCRSDLSQAREYHHPYVSSQTVSSRVESQGQSDNTVANRQSALPIGFTTRQSYKSHLVLLTEACHVESTAHVRRSLLLQSSTSSWFRKHDAPQQSGGRVSARAFGGVRSLTLETDNWIQANIDFNMYFLASWSY